MRFGADIPKQYLLLNGRPVISYVIEACRKCREADAVLVVADPMYHEELQSLYGVDVAENGPELNITKRNGIDYIQKHSSCEKLVVAEAVRPALTPEILENTFKLLDDYDAVACARRITDSLGHYGEWVVDRSEYYTLNPPEGFRFQLLYQYFDPRSVCTETIQQLPDNTRIYLNFDVPYLDKITYREDLEKAEALMRWRETHANPAEKQGRRTEPCVY